MIGVDCERSKLVVVDVDLYHGEAVSEALERLCEATQATGWAGIGNELADAPCVRTPSGGLHFYLGANPEYPIKKSESKVAPYIDVRAIGAYIVAPGSERSDGRRYEWENGPSDIIEISSKDLARTLAADKPTPKVTISEGSRNSRLTSIAGTVLQEVNRTLCNPPLPAKEVDSIVHSITKRELAKEPKPEAGLYLESFSRIEPQKVEWEWDSRIPQGKVTLLVGDPGGGKSFLSLAIAAGITRGTRLPGDNRPDALPGDVIIMNFEDGAADTIRPRADLCRVNTDRLHRVAFKDEFTSFSLDHLAELEKMMDRLPNPRMVIIDPIANLLGATDTAKDNKVRASLAPLVAFAERRNVAVVCVMHLNKTETQKVIYRVGGSIAFIGFVRSVLLVGVDEESGRRSVVPIKHNLCKAAKAVEFTISDTGFAWNGEADDLGAEQMLGMPTAKDKQSQRDKARTFLVEILKNGALEANEVYARCASENHSKRTVDRACQELAIVKGKTGGGGWTWELPPAYKVPVPPVPSPSLSTLSTLSTLSI